MRKLFIVLMLLASSAIAQPWGGAPWGGGYEWNGEDFGQHQFDNLRRFSPYFFFAPNRRPQTVLDAGGNNPFSGGYLSNVATLVDLSANARNATQGTDGNRPVFTTATGYVAVDATDDYMNLPATFAVTSFSMYAIVSVPAGISNKWMLGEFTVYGAGLLFNTATNMRLFTDGSDVLTLAVSGTTTQCLIEVHDNAGAIIVYCNGVQTGTGTEVTPGSLGVRRIFARNTTEAGWGGNMWSMVMFPYAAPTSGTANMIRQTLARQNGIDLP